MKKMNTTRKIFFLFAFLTLITGLSVIFVPNIINKGTGLEKFFATVALEIYLFPIFVICFLVFIISAIASAFTNKK